MRFIKRIGSFLAAAAILLSSIPVCAYEFDSYSDDNNTTFLQRQQLFMNLGVLDEAKDAQDLVTRAEFAHILVRFFDLNRYSAYIDNISFTDISSEKYAKDIECVYANKIMTSIDSKLFRPGDPITLNDVARAMTCALGYEYAAQVKYGDKDESYISACSELKLLKGIGTKEAVYAISYIELLQILENSLDVKFVEVDIRSGEDIRYKVSDNTVMNSVFKCEKANGVVTATSITSLYGGEEAGVGQVEIDGVRYGCDADTENLLGYKVNYYRSIDDERILYLCEDLEKNNDLVINGKDIDSYTGRRYTYYNSRGAAKHINLPAGCAVIYNGRASSNQTSVSFNMVPKNGTVKFIDNTNDGKYDVVIIEEYISVVVGVVDTVNQTIYDKFDNTLKYSIKDINEKFISIRSADGKELSFGNIKAGNVVSVAQSKDETRTKMIISVKKAEGTLDQINEDYALIDGIRYETSSDVRNISGVKSGKTVTAYIDCNDRVVYVEPKNGSIEVVYLTKGFVDEDKEILTLKFCNSSGVIDKADCDEKLFINDARQKDVYKALALLCDQSGEVVPQMLTVARNDSGEINKIYTVWTGEKKKCPPEALMLNSTITDTAYKYIAANNIFMDYKTALSSNCKIFFIPTDLSDADEFSVLSASELKDDKSYGYNTNPFYAYILGSDSVLCNYAVATASLSPKRSSSYGIIKKIKGVYDEEKGEECTEVEMYYGGEESIRFYSDSGIDVNNISPYTASISSETYSLTPGDLISYNYDIQNGKLLMTSVSMIYDYETQRYLSINPSTTNTKESVFYLADVWKKSPGYLGLAVNGENSQYSNPKPMDTAFSTSAQNYRVENVASASIYRSDGSGKNIVSVDFADIIDYSVSQTQYSQVIIMAKLGKATCCYIIN